MPSHAAGQRYDLSEESGFSQRYCISHGPLQSPGANATLSFAAASPSGLSKHAESTMRLGCAGFISPRCPRGDVHCQPYRLLLVMACSQNAVVERHRHRSGSGSKGHCLTLPSAITHRRWGRPPPLTSDPRIPRPQWLLLQALGVLGCNSAIDYPNAS